MHTDLVAALDIGGTKIAGALVDGHGRILLRAQRATPAQEDGETVMGAVEAVVGELTASPLWSRAQAVGIGSAGPVDASAGTVSPVNVPAGAATRWSSGCGPRRVACPWNSSATVWRSPPPSTGRARPRPRQRVVHGGVDGRRRRTRAGGRLYPGRPATPATSGTSASTWTATSARAGRAAAWQRIASGPNIARRALEGGWQPGPDGDTSAAAVAAAAREGDPVAVASFERAAAHWPRASPRPPRSSRSTSR